METLKLIPTLRKRFIAPTALLTLAIARLGYSLFIYATLPYRIFVRHLSEIRYCQDNGTPFHHFTAYIVSFADCRSYPVHFQREGESAAEIHDAKNEVKFRHRKIWPIVRQPVKTFLLEFSSVLSYSMEAVVHYLLFT